MEQLLFILGTGIVVLFFLMCLWIRNAQTESGEKIDYANRIFNDSRIGNRYRDMKKRN